MGPGYHCGYTDKDSAAGTAVALDEYIAVSADMDACT